VKIPIVNSYTITFIVDRRHMSIYWSFLPIGLCGGSASGKTTVARKIIEALDVPWVVLLSMDSFYKVTPSSHCISLAR